MQCNLHCEVSCLPPGHKHITATIVSDVTVTTLTCVQNAGKCGNAGSCLNEQLGLYCYEWGAGYTYTQQWKLLSKECSQAVYAAAPAFFFALPYHVLNSIYFVPGMMHVCLFKPLEDRMRGWCVCREFALCVCHYGCSCGHGHGHSRFFLDTITRSYIFTGIYASMIDMRVSYLANSPCIHVLMYTCIQAYVHVFMIKELKTCIA